MLVLRLPVEQRADKALDFKLRCCHWQLSSFPFGKNNVLKPEISRALLPMTSKADKLPMETEPVACDKETS